MIGIRRGQQRITSPGAADRIAAGDHLIVVGSCEAIHRLRASSPL